jgi:hypothetical protein
MAPVTKLERWTSTMSTPFRGEIQRVISFPGFWLFRVYVIDRTMLIIDSFVTFPL